MAPLRDKTAPHFHAVERRSQRRLLGIGRHRDLLPGHQRSAVRLSSGQSRHPGARLELNRVRAIAELRGRYQAFGRGTFEALLPHNRSVLAFIRRHEDEVIPHVNNLSRHAEYALHWFQLLQPGSPTPLGAVAEDGA